MENRSRNLGNYRGPVLLHAAKGMTMAEWYSAHAFVAHFDMTTAGKIPHPKAKALVRSAIVGVANVVNQCAPGAVWARDPKNGLVTVPKDWEEQKRWYMGEHAYLLDEVRAFREPVPCAGKLGLWHVPADIEKLVEMAMGAT